MTIQRLTNISNIISQLYNCICTNRMYVLPPSQMQFFEHKNVRYPQRKHHSICIQIPLFSPTTFIFCKVPFFFCFWQNASPCFKCQLLYFKFLLLYLKCFKDWKGILCRNPKSTILNTLVCWFAGTNDLSTKRLTFQALFFFSNFIQTNTHLGYSKLFIFHFCKFIRKKMIETILANNFARNYEKRIIQSIKPLSVLQ